MAKPQKQQNISTAPEPDIAPLPPDSVLVKMLQSIASESFSYRPGEIVALGAALAAAWSASGICRGME